MNSMIGSNAMRVVHKAGADGLKRASAASEALGSWFVALDGPGEAFDPAPLVELARAQWPLLPQLAVALRQCTWAWPLPWADAGFLFVPPERMPERCAGYIALRRPHDTLWLEFMPDPDDARRIVLVRMQAEARGLQRPGYKGRPDGGM